MKEDHRHRRRQRCRHSLSPGCRATHASPAGGTSATGTTYQNYSKQTCAHPSHTHTHTHTPHATAHSSEQPSVPRQTLCALSLYLTLLSLSFSSNSPCLTGQLCTGQTAQEQSRPSLS